MVNGANGSDELSEFIADLRKLREQAGQPSLRAMSKLAHYSHTALSGVVTSGHLPSLDLTLAFVRACGGDESEWRTRWSHARAAAREEAVVEAVPPPPPPAGRRRRWFLIVGAASLAAAAAIAGVTASVMGDPAAPALTASHDPRLSAQQHARCPARPDPGDRPLVPCDDSRFVADVTIPDGMTVRAGQSFVKTWEIENIGLVPWQGRFIQRQGVLSGQGLCSSPSRVPVPTTMPGQDALITVTFTAPNLPGSCRVDWKMTDKDGRFFFPNLGSLYVIVNVSG
jgi:hypothetical protein